MVFRAFNSREKLAEALAKGVAAVLAGGIATNGSAVLAVSGGSTPALFFERLSMTDLDWSRVTVTLVDERFVLPSNARSNAGLVSRSLLIGKAAAAKFVPMITLARDFETEHIAYDRQLALLGPLDACILGMGTDGHTASFFPGGDHLAEAIDPQGGRDVVTMIAPGAGEPRLTLTLRRLVDAHFLALHIEGDEKRTIYEKALGDGPVAEMPVRAVIRCAGERLQTFWAP